MESSAVSRPTIANVRIEDLSAVRIFMDKAYKPRDVTCLDDYFQWQFDRCAGDDRSSDNRALMTVVDGRVVGLCLVPEYEISMSNRIVRGGWIHHWFTEAGQGPIGLAMLRRLLRDLSFFGGAGISSQGLAAMRLLCPALVVFELTRLFAVFDADATFDLVFDRAPGTRTYLRSLRVPRPSSTRVDRVETFDDEYERAWDAMRSSFLFATHRTAKYMNWRYFNHPYFQYKGVRCCGSSGPVYYVWREEPIHGHGRTVVRLCDVIGPMAAIEETFSSAFAAMSEERPLFVDFYCSNAEVVASLVAGGMQPAVTRSDFDLPRLFQPLVRDSSRTLHFYYQLSPPFEVPRYTAFASSYITKTDSNQDRPNFVSG
jgi:hypothetical protein